MAGYCGRSMSNNAIEAYANGEKPISKWRKSDIINYVEEYAGNNELKFSIDLLKKVKLKVLKDQVLSFTVSHHMGYKYKLIDFFAPNNHILSKLTDEDIKGWL